MSSICVNVSICFEYTRTEYQYDHREIGYYVFPCPIGESANSRVLTHELVNREWKKYFKENEFEILSHLSGNWRENKKYTMLNVISYNVTA